MMKMFVLFEFPTHTLIELQSLFTMKLGPPENHDRWYYFFFIQISRYKVKKKKIWHHIDHDGRIKSYLKHYQPALSLSYVLCRVRFLFMFINAFKLLRAAQFVSHTGPFSILRNHLSFIDSLFYQQLGWNCIILLNMWRSIIGYKSLYQTIVPHFHAETKTKKNKKKLERGIFYFNFIPLKAGKN